MNQHLSSGVKAPCFLGLSRDSLSCIPTMHSVATVLQRQDIKLRLGDFLVSRTAGSTSSTLFPTTRAAVLSRSSLCNSSSSPRGCFSEWADSKLLPSSLAFDVSKSRAPAFYSTTRSLEYRGSMFAFSGARAPSQSGSQSIRERVGAFSTFNGVLLVRFHSYFMGPRGTSG